MASEIGSLYYDLNIDDKKLRSQLDRADNSVKNFGTSVSRQWQKSVDASKKFMLGLTGLATASVAFGAKSYQAFKESQQSVSQLNTVLKSTHGAAGLFIEDLTDQASALQKLSKFTDEEVQSAQALLLTFTNIKGGVFQEAIPVILDMSQALGQDLKSSSIQLGKALNDPIEGINALRRVGVSFTDKQREQIEVLVKSGKTMDAQRLILKELTTEFGGSAKAASDAAGPMERIKDVWGESQEIAGRLINKAIDPLIERFSKWSEKVDEQAIERFVNNVLAWLRTNGDSLAGVVGGALAPAVFALASSFAILALRITPFSVIGLIIANFDELIERFKRLSPLIQVALVFLGAFTTLLGGLFVANMIKASITATTQLGGALSGVTTTFKILAATLGSPLVMPAIVVAAALASLYEVKKAVDAVKGAFDAMNAAARSQADLEASNLQVRARLEQLAKNGTPAQRERARAALAAGIGRAAGGPVMAGTPYMTGERGRELFVPTQNGLIIPNKLTESLMRGRGGDTIVNIGTIQDRADADYVISKVTHNQWLEGQGLSPAR